MKNTYSKYNIRIHRTGNAIRRWTQQHCSAYTFAVLVGIIIGVLTGGCAWLLKLMISAVSHLLIGNGGNGADWLLLVLPLTGILLVVAYQHFILRRNIEHGVEQVQQHLRDGRFRLGNKMVYAPLIASTLTLGFGGSAGSEGPIATTGSAIGSGVGRFFGMTHAQLRVMIGIGAGAGIAGIFKAPIGGALFTIEVLMLEMTTLPVITLIISCIASSMTAYALSSCTYDINVAHQVIFDTSIIPWVFVLGVLCGIYSVYYSWIMKHLSRFFEKISNIWFRAIFSGIILSVCVFLFPSLYGEGYNTLTQLLNGDKTVLTAESLFYALHSDPTIVILLLAGLLAAKPAAACSSNSGGGVAGDFAPTLFAGGMFGFLFALAANTWFGAELTTAGFAYIGMAGVMAGAIRAPLMAMFLTAEMCDGYQFLLPLLIAVTISYCIVKATANDKRGKTTDTPIKMPGK